MKTILSRIDYDTSKTIFTLYPFFDVHLGSAACNEALVRQDIEACASDPTGLALLGGDVIDGISHKDPRMNLETLATWCKDSTDVIRSEIKYAGRLFEPLQNKVVAILDGNHEDANKHWHARDVYRDLCASIMAGAEELPSRVALGYGGFIVLRFNFSRHVTTVKIYARHGSGGGKKPGGKMNNATDMAKSSDIDISISGHVHSELTHSFKKTVPAIKDQGESTAKDVNVVICGSYLGNSLPRYTDQVDGSQWPVDTYAVKKDYLPGKVGMPRILIAPFVPEVAVLTGSSDLINGMARNNPGVPA